MVGLFGYNMFNQNNGTGRELWAMTLRQGGGNPEMKVNPIYVKEAEENAAETIEGNIDRAEATEDVKDKTEAVEDTESTDEKNEECETIEESEIKLEEDIKETVE